MKRVNLLKKMFVLVAFLALAGVGWALTQESTTTIKVDSSSGNDENAKADPTFATAFQTLQAAITAANGVAGSDVVISIAAGSYEAPAWDNGFIEGSTGTFGVLTKANTRITAAASVAANQVTLTGTLQIEAENVTVSGLTFVNKCGNDYRSKNSLNVKADKVTITGNTFKVAERTASGGICNGVVLRSQTAATDYKITGNTFNIFNKSVADENFHTTWLSCGIIWCDMQDAPFVKEADSVIASGNTFVGCFSDYQRGYFDEGADYMTKTFYFYGQISNPNEASLKDAVDFSRDNTIIKIAGEWALTEALVLEKAVKLSSIKADAPATINGFLVVKAEGATVKDLTFTNSAKSSLYKEKNAISVFANSATITGNTFNTGTVANNAIPNGIVLYPKGNGQTVEGDYTINGNTFNQTTAGTTGIIVRENFFSTTQFGVAAGEADNWRTASLSNGGKLDAEIVNNTFAPTFAGDYYARVTGDYSVLDATGTGAETLTQKLRCCYIHTGASLNEALTSMTDASAIMLAAGTYDMPEGKTSFATLATDNVSISPAKKEDFSKAVVNGHLVVKAEGTYIYGLKFTPQSVGFEGWEKTAIVLIGSSAKIEECAFEGNVSDAKYVANGINLLPTAAKTDYVITNNSFKNFNQKTADGWTATAVLLQDKCTLTKQNGESVSIDIPEVKGFDETAIVKNNTFTDCFADYTHTTANKYVYSSTQSADGIADAWLSMDKGTIDAPTVANDAALTALNATEKPALTGKAIAIRCSDAWLVTNEGLAGSDLPVLVITKVGDGDYEAVKKTVAPTIDNSTLTASTIEAGQTLSASILSGGKATVTNSGKTVEIAGTFAWEDPKTAATEGEQTYTVIFTPSDLSSYSVAKTSYTFSGKNAIKQYYTVTTGKCENGRVEIKEANAANRYLKGSTLTLVYHPDANYKTKADAATTLSVTEDKVVTTTFEAIMHTVTIAASENGKVSVNGKEYAAGSSNTISVQQGSELTVQAIPTTAEYVGSLTCSDSKVISNGVVTVDKPFTITASFTAKPKDEFVVSVPAVQNGKILLYDKNGNAINAGSSVTSGSEVSVLAVPDLGYQLTSDGLKNNGTSITDGKITVTANASITAAFEKQTFAVTKTEKNATIAISGTGFESLDQVPYGTTLTASVTSAEGYKLLSLVVNGKEIADGGSFVVTATTNVNAVMRKLATIVIDKTPQAFVYDGSKKEFVVKTIPAGIGGFKVEYEGTPQEVENHIQKAYKVIITRDADDVYAAVTAEQGTIDGGLVILAAEMKGVAIPTATSGTISTTSDQGTYAWKTGGGESNAIHDAIFTPTSGNYKTATFSILTGNGTPPTTVTLDWNGLRTRSTTPQVSFNVNGGSLSALNGSASLSSGSTLYATQKIRLVATPDATHAAKVTWSVSGSGASLSDQTATEATLTLADANTTVTATFAEKVSPTFPGLSGLDNVVYDGTIYGTGMPEIKGGTGAVTDNWLVTFKQGGIATSTPINAGTYDIYVSRPADAIYDAVIDKPAGSFTIARKAVTASVTAATPVLKGQSLAQSVLSGTADVDGSFVWIDPTVLMTATSDQKAKFVPANANYKESGALTTNVTVNEATGVTLRTLNVNITNPEKGTVTMTLNGGEVVAGASVTKDDKLIVTYAATAANYKASATIGGNTYASGTEYTVPESGNVEVAVSFVYNNPNPNPGTDPDPDPSTVDVTGVTLVPVSKTLGINETLTLEATVTPSNATDKGVSWSSSAPGIASVDSKGNVKALKAGTSTITVTTNDGGFTATCKITVSVSTGIDDILSGARVYAQEGRIVVEPAMTVQVLVADMTGHVIWQGKLSEKKQMTVPAGVYVVRLSNDQGIQTRKVIVQ